MQIEELNEIEILEFNIKNIKFGIEVSYIQEIVVNKNLTSIPLAPKEIIGIFQMRNDIYTVIDLSYALFKEKTNIEKKSFYILSNFDEKNNAFLVDKVSNIIKETKDNIMPTPVILGGTYDINIKGIIKNNDDLILILDFEKIIKNIGNLNCILNEEILEEIYKYK